MINNVKPKIDEISFVRVICAIGIICFHFNFHTQSDISFLLSYKNGDWGGTFVAIFFAISGMMLHYTSPRVDSLKLFYYKRWKAIFPSFYICFLFFFIKNVIKHRKLFYGPNPITLILSLLGIDGYFLYLIDNYYLIGEWFLGAIIILYLLYPLISVVVSRYRSNIIFAILLFCVYVGIQVTNIFIVDNSHNIISCMFSFYVGIMFMKYYSFFFKNKMVLFFAGIIMAIFLTIDLELPPSISNNLFGFSLLIVLSFFGNLIMKVEFLKKITIFLSEISYQIFLFQHQVIAFTLKRYKPTDNVSYVLLLTIVIIITIVLAKLLLIATKTILKSKGMMKIERVILKLK